MTFSPVANSTITLTIDGISQSMAWHDFVTSLTQYPCASGSCASEIASTSALETFWCLFTGLLLFFLQIGFKCLEIGGHETLSRASVRGSKMLTKTLTDACMSALGLYVVGFAFGLAPGSSDNPVLGEIHFALTGLNDPIDSACFVFLWATTCYVVAIVHAAGAGRVSGFAQACLCICIGILIFPALVHSVWHPRGWASPRSPIPIFTTGVVDLAGGGVIHMTAGLLSLILVLLLESGNSNSKSERGGPDEIQSAAFHTLGTLFCWIGSFGFASSVTIHPLLRASTVVNLALAASASGLMVLVLSRLLTQSWNPLMLNKGILAGLVGISSGCAVVEPYAAIAIGCSSALVYLSLRSWCTSLDIQDTFLDIVSIHFGCGVWSLVCAGLFTTPELYQLNYGTESSDDDVCGVLYGCSESWFLLLAQVAFVFVILGFVGFVGLVILWSLHFGFKLHRDSEDHRVTRTTQEDEYAVAYHALPEHPVEARPRTLSIETYLQSRSSNDLLNDNVSSSNDFNITEFPRFTEFQYDDVESEDCVSSLEDTSDTSEDQYRYYASIRHVRL